MPRPAAGSVQGETTRRLEGANEKWCKNLQVRYNASATWWSLRSKSNYNDQGVLKISRMSSNSTAKQMWKETLEWKWHNTLDHWFIKILVLYSSYCIVFLNVFLRLVYCVLHNLKNIEEAENTSFLLANARNWAEFFSAITVVVLIKLFLRCRFIRWQVAIKWRQPYNTGWRST